MTVTPPINEADFKQWEADDNGYFIYEQVDGDEDVKIVNGQITVVGQTPGFTVAKFGYDESLKAYDFSEQVDTFVAKCKSLGHVVEGAFYGDGEESDDFWKINVIKNVVSHEEGMILYASERYQELETLGRQPNAHGNVIPRPDGQRVLCGGAPKCTDCQTEYERLSKMIYGR